MKVKQYDWNIQGGSKNLLSKTKESIVLIVFFLDHPVLREDSELHHLYSIAVRNRYETLCLDNQRATKSINTIAKS